MIEPKLQIISISHQCVLLDVSRRSHYYQAKHNANKTTIKGKIVDVFKEIVIFGAAKVH